MLRQEYTGVGNKAMRDTIVSGRGLLRPLQKALAPSRVGGFRGAHSGAVAKHVQGFRGAMAKQTI